MSNFVKKPLFTAVIPAAGGSTRMGGVDKLLVKMQGKSLIVHTLEIFARNPSFAGVVLVSSLKNFSLFRDLIENFNLGGRVVVVEGGETRAHSVYRGLLAAKTPYVAVHDGARPFLSQNLLENLLQEALKSEGCIPVLPATDTVKFVDCEGIVKNTPPRREIVLVQTPQVFSRQALTKAYESVLEGEIPVTDDSSVMEMFGYRVKTIPGEKSNIKITNPADLQIAGLYLGEKGLIKNEIF